MKIEITLPKNTDLFITAKLQKQLEALALLDQDTLAKLVELSKSEKAIKKLNNNWKMIKATIM